MPVDLSPKSHVDTPAWQSFELRMRARAADRRRARRARRVRRLKLSAVGVLALALGVTSAFGWRALNERGLIDRARSAGANIENTLEKRITERMDAAEVVAVDPRSIEWPSPPSSPEALAAARISALPLPSGWDAAVDSQQPQAVSTEAVPEQTAAAEPEPRNTPLSTLPRGETSDDVTVPEVVRRERTSERVMPSSTRTLPTPGAASAPETKTRTVDPPLQPPPSTNGLSASSGSMPAAERPPAVVPPRLEPPVRVDSTRISSSEPSVGTSGRNLSAEPPVGADRRNPTAEPPVGTSGRNLTAEPTGGTDRRNPLSEPNVAVRSVLERYRSAYQRLDASAARAVWPGVDAGALARAFSSLSSQALRFEACSINVAGQTADASCKGETNVVPKFGGGSETARRTWDFKLRQTGTDWIIEKATVK